MKRRWIAFAPDRPPPRPPPPHLHQTQIRSGSEDSVTLSSSAGPDCSSRNRGSNWMHKGTPTTDPAPSPGGRTAGCMYAGGRRDLYWKPLRQRDVSDRKASKINNWKNDEKWEENETLEGRSVWGVTPLRVARSSGEGGNGGRRCCVFARASASRSGSRAKLEGYRVVQGLE